MAKMQMDAIDASFVVVGLASAFMLVGIATFNLFGVGFEETLFSVANVNLSTAWVLGYASIVGTIVTNENTERVTFMDFKGTMPSPRAELVCGSVVDTSLPASTPLQIRIRESQLRHRWARLSSSPWIRATLGGR